MPDFVPVDLSRPVDLGAHLAALPKNATVKGMYFGYVVEIGASHLRGREIFAAAGVEPRRFVPFLDYSAADYLRILCAAASAMSPSSLPRGLYRIGRGIYPLFADSRVGKTMSELLGRDPERTLPHAPRVWKISMSFGEVTADVPGSKQIVYSFKNLPLFLSCYQFGVLEGALAGIGASAEVTARIHDVGNADFLVRWR